VYLIELIKEGRSINFFEQDREIPEVKVREILFLTNLAPSSFNLQPRWVLFFGDNDRKRNLSACAMNPIYSRCTWAKRCPIVLDESLGYTGMAAARLGYRGEESCGALAM
jgi:nitroreductase